MNKEPMKGKRIHTSVELDLGLYKKLKYYCIDEEISMRKFLQELIKKEFKGKKLPKRVDEWFRE